LISRLLRASLSIMRNNLKYFYSSFIWTIIGLIGALFIGHYYEGSWNGALQMLALCIILSLLEVSISFDNAVVNATVLKDMTPLWRHRFLTWGMWIAVFGMRLIFPLMIVSIVASMGPWEALVLAAKEPKKYAEIMLSVHHEVSAFGGAFLMLVCFKYFFDLEKEVHWISVIERPLAKLGKLQAIEVGLVLIILYVLSKYVPSEEVLPVMISGIAGIVTFIAVDGLGAVLKVPEATQADLHRQSLGMFLYLEVLDASFSFDGVIGAFAITNNLFIIAIGLGIGALFVRSLTYLMVEQGTLSEFKYLENGAFWAVGALATIMFLNTIFHIPEIITGVIGITFIGFSLWSSLRLRKASANEVLHG